MTALSQCCDSEFQVHVNIGFSVGRPFCFLTAWWAHVWKHLQESPLLERRGCSRTNPWPRGVKKDAVLRRFPGLPKLWRGCSAEGVGVHQGFEVALLTWTSVSATSQGAESPDEWPLWPQVLPSCMSVCGEGSSASLRGLFVESMAGGPWAPRSPEAALINRATPSSTALHRLSVLIQLTGTVKHSKGCFPLSLCSHLFCPVELIFKKSFWAPALWWKTQEGSVKPSTLREHVL